jgi:polar amino acid transport system substrate-binding protein
MPVNRSLIVLAAILTGTVTACSPYPADIGGSLEQAQQNALEVGVSDAPPWIEWNEGAPVGVEADIIRQFAEAEGLQIRWVQRDETTLMAALEHGEIHLLAAGLTKTTPWKRHVSLSEPISVCKAYIGVPDTASDTAIEQLTVRVERASGLIKLAEKRGAAVDPVTSLAEGKGPAAAEEYYLAEQGLTPVGDALSRSVHVLALPKGENALFAALTRSLPSEPGCVPASRGPR